MKADILLMSDNIFTGTTDSCRSGFVAIKGNKILKVGALEEVIHFIDFHTKVYDFKDYMIIPGFIESHMHFFLSALVNEKIIKMIEGNSEVACVQSLLRQLNTDSSNDWIIGLGWYYPEWENKGLPTRKLLDQYFPEQPVAMISADIHTLWLNTKGLQKLNLSKETINIHDKNYVLEEDGELSGVLMEMAGMIRIPEILKQKKETLLESYGTYMEQLASYGLTSISDLSALAVKGDDMIYVDVYEDLQLNNQLLQRVHLYPTMGDDLQRIKKLQAVVDGSKVVLSGVKQFYDGVISTHTAYLTEGYENPFYANDRGTLTIAQEEMHRLIMKATKNQLPMRIHTIGDGAIRLALESFEKARETYGELKKGHHTLEHLELLNDREIQKLRDLNIVASVQPSHLLIDYGHVERDVGKVRIQKMWPFKDLLDKDVVLAFGTDSPVVVDVTPLENIYYAVSRATKEQQPEEGWMPHQKIDILNALLAHTKGASFAIGREHELGTLETDKLADITVLDRNILLCEDSVELLDVRIVTTIMDGKISYQKSDLCSAGISTV